MTLASLREGFTAWRNRRAAMRDLDVMRRDEKPFDEINVGVLLQKIKDAALREDKGLLMRHWTEMRGRYPDYAMTSREAILALLDLDLYDEADDILKESLKKYADLHKIMEIWGEVAQLRGDFAEAARRWEVVRERFPNEPRAFARGAVSLKQLGRMEEAEVLLEKAFAIDPRDVVVLTEYAKIAADRGDWAASLQRWTMVRMRAETPLAWVECANCLRELGRLDEAEALLTEAAWRFQIDARPLTELACIPHRKGDWPEAIRRWERMRASFPLLPTGYVAAAQALRAAGRSDEAEEMLLAAVKRIGETSPQPLIEYARFAHDRADWPEAIRRWEMVRERVPDGRIGFNMGAQALEAAGRGQEAAALRSVAQPGAPANPG